MKIGVITHYYKSENYGGNLQAYALCKVLNNMGYEAEQICLDRNKGLPLLRAMKVRLSRIKNGLDLRAKAKLKQRKKAFQGFNLGVIPHSDCVYTEKTIYACADKYDAFITGSDQVWHPYAVCDPYLLKFAPSNKIKMSYAASVACSSLTNEQKSRYKEAMKDYKAISVREKDAVSLLEGVTPFKVEMVLDPTLLLSRKDWEGLEEKAEIKEKYLFCYFLGGDIKQRRLACEYAKRNGLRVVTLPHLLGKYRGCDKDFGDLKLYEVSPNKLISLVKNAECVFTDSFHITVFSSIFEKKHFIFEREGHKGMGSRIYTLTQTFKTEALFCDTEEKTSIEYIESVDKFEIYKGDYEAEKEKSIAFLKENLS